MTTQDENTAKVFAKRITNEFETKITSFDILGRNEKGDYIEKIIENHNLDSNAHSPIIEILNTKNNSQDVEIAKKANISSLATVATSGVYNDLTGKPDLATVATSGDYDDLLNKPTIPAAQVNSDWNAESGITQILNKPSLSTVATSGSYNDLLNKPTIPSKTSDLINDTGFLTSGGILNVNPHSLKSYLDEGEALTDVEGLVDVMNYAHSTYCGDQASDAPPLDAKKFIKIGSISPSNDGIVSGFSTSNYLKGTYTLDVTNPWQVSCSIITGATAAAEQNGIWSWATNFVLSLFSGNIIKFQNAPTSELSCTKALATNSKYHIITGWDGTNYYIKVYDENGLYDSTTTAGAAHVALTGTYFAIGVNATTNQSTRYNPFINGSIDLKGFEVWSDGVPVFSGSQTGTDTYTIGSSTVNVPYTLSKTGSKVVDSAYRTQVSAVYNEFGYAPYYTLKEDGAALRPTFTKVGSPTVTEDNVASNFSNSNYFTAPLTFLGAWTFSCKFNVSEWGEYSLVLMSTGPTESNKYIKISDHNIIGTGIHFIWHTDFPTTTYFQANTNYLLTINYDGNQTYTTTVKNLDNNTIAVTATITSSTSFASGTDTWRIGATTVTEHQEYNLPFNGSIDLNSLNVELEKQYYPNFTVPQGELYGMIEKLTDSKVNNLVPDYNSGIDIHSYSGNANPYICPSNGFVIACGLTGSTSSTPPLAPDITINNVIVASVPPNGCINSIIPVKSGDSVFFTFDSYSSCKFYPMRGA